MVYIYIFWYNMASIEFGKYRKVLERQISSWCSMTSIEFLKLIKMNFFLGFKNCMNLEALDSMLEKHSNALRVGMTMGWVYLGTRPVPSLMGWSLILINRFVTGLRFFLKTRDWFEYCPTPPSFTPIIYKINF